VGQGGTLAENFSGKNLRTISNIQLAPFVQFQICHFLVTFQIAKRRLMSCKGHVGQKVGQGGTLAENFTEKISVLISYLHETFHIRKYMFRLPKVLFVHELPKSPVKSEPEPLPDSTSELLNAAGGALSPSPPLPSPELWSGGSSACGNVGCGGDNGGIIRSSRPELASPELGCNGVGDVGGKSPSPPLPPPEPKSGELPTGCNITGFGFLCVLLLDSRKMKQKVKVQKRQKTRS